MSSVVALSGQHEVDQVNGEIRALMGRHRVSQKVLAHWLAIPQSQVSTRLSGRTEWKLSELFRVAEAFDVAPGSLLGMTKPPRREGGGVPIDAVRHQGLEPRTRWLTASADGVVVQLLPVEVEGGAL